MKKRKEWRLTQQQLADAIGTHLRTVQGWEKEGRRPIYTHAQRLGAFFDDWSFMQQMGWLLKTPRDLRKLQAVKP